jgi:oligopeptidase B
MMNKMNTFTDFISSAEYLVAQRYTSKDRLAIMGGSAGGLLMGAVTNLRPDLFKVVVTYVPFVDVINTMLDETLPLTVGEFEEWGNPKKPDDYRYMKQYSPYDNVTAKAYPIMLVRSSYNDSQVMYWEPAKYVAKLRSVKTDSNPLLFKINMDPAGHGGMSGRYDRLKDVAYDYAFIVEQLVGLQLAQPTLHQAEPPGTRQTSIN